jgi:hypothetical protein
MWIGMYVRGSFYEKFEVIYELDQLIKDDDMT